MKIIAIKYATFLSLVLILIACTPSKKQSALYTSNSGRVIETLKTGWSFKRGEFPNAKSISFDDSNWQKVSIPHCYNIESGQSGGSPGTHWSKSVYYMGPAWYRYKLKVNQLPKNRSKYLKFNAVSSVADIFVNGKKIGTHKGAFTAFCFDITKYLKPNSTNLIAVRASNKYREDLAPISGDFVMFGGIYRPVTIISTPKVCIDPLDFASTGVYITQKKISRKRAHLDIKTLVRNASKSAKKIIVTTKILDDSNYPVAETSKELSVAPNSNTNFTTNIVINNPHLWQGIEDPYLYKVQTTLIQNDKIIDSQEEKIGLRWFKVDPKKGFFLNGKPYKIRGVNKHQDKLNKGWALTEGDLQQDLDIALEMGANGLRLAHYPHSQYFHKLCDKAGMLVWAEIPLVDVVKNTPEFHANTLLQLEEMIKQNYNRPSIFAWGLWNELLMRKSDDPTELAFALSKRAKQLDPIRYTTCAANFYAAHMQKIGRKIFPSVDIPAFNIYQGWYGGKPSQLNYAIRGYNKIGKLRGIAISEYGAGASILHQQDLPCRPKPTSRFHPEQWQAYVHEQNYAQIRNNPIVWGSFIWNLFDFASTWRSEGDSIGRNDKGLVTYDRKHRKDAFYFYKACWSQKPVLHLTSKRHKIRTNAKMIIKAYSNCDSVTAYLNGKSLGSKSSKNNIFTWEATLKPGENKIKLTANKSTLQLEDSATCKLDTDFNFPNRWILASKSSHYNVPEYTLATDKNARYFWGDNSKNAWIRYMLDPNKEFGQIKIAWAKNKVYNFAVQISHDAKNWITISKGKSSGKKTTYQICNFPKCSAKYLRIICTDKNDKSNGLEIYNIQLKSLAPKY